MNVPAPCAAPTPSSVMAEELVSLGWPKDHAEEAASQLLPAERAKPGYGKGLNALLAAACHNVQSKSGRQLNAFDAQLFDAALLDCLEKRAVLAIVVGNALDRAGKRSTLNAMYVRHYDAAAHLWTWPPRHLPL